MTKKNKPTAVITTLDSLQTNREDIPNFLLQVNKQITAIKKGMPESTVTICNFPEINKPIIKIKSVNELIKINSILNVRQNAFKESRKELGLSVSKYPYKHGGHTVKEWKSDIKYQLNKVANSNKLEALNKIKTLLESNLSKDDKLAKDLLEAKNILLNFAE